MERDTKSIEYEIVDQILIAEICFDICKSVPIIPGRGSDFLPFYYNLVFSKGIISLHSLLLSSLPDELSIKNYLKRHRLDFPSMDIDDFETEIVFISKLFQNILPISLRHKVFAHIDQGFRHADFTNAYIIPESVEKYISLIQDLKKLFFKFCNHSQGDYHKKILEQSKSIIEKIVSDSNLSHRQL